MRTLREAASVIGTTIALIFMFIAGWVVVGMCVGVAVLAAKMVMGE